MLTELQRIPTMGARAVAAFTRGGTRWLAVPQLAADAPGTPPGINGGDSGTEVLLLREGPDGFVAAGTLPVGGGEDAEVFELDGRIVIGVASIRTGRGPYDFAAVSTLFADEADRFVPLQHLDTFAAKQLRHFRIGSDDFLAVAQGMPDGPRTSTVLRWDGARFVHFQDLESAAGYNIAVFEIDGITYLAHADHVRPSVLYRFDGSRFVEHQQLIPAGGRAFQLMRRRGGIRLAAARIDGDSLVLQWDGSRFGDPSPLPGGAGGREFAVIESDAATHLLRVDFIHGTPAEPLPDLESHVYRFDDDGVVRVGGFRTTGATDVTVLPPGADGGVDIAVSNGLAAAPVPGHTFAGVVVLYRFTAP